MTVAFETSAVLLLEDRITAGLEKLYGSFNLFDERVLKTQAGLDKLGLGGVVAKMRAEWKEIGGLASAGVAGIAAKFDTLGVKVAPGFAGLTGEAGKAFGKIIEGAGGLPAEVAQKLSGLGTLTAPEFDKILPGATSAFGKVLDEVKGLNTGIAEQLAGLEGISTAAFAAIPNAARAAGVEAVAAIRASMGEISAMRAEVAIAPMPGFSKAAAAVEASPAISKAVEADAGRAFLGQRSTGGPHFGRVGGDAGGVHVSMGGNAGLAVAGLALDGIYEAALIDDAVAKALMSSQIPIGPGVSNADAGKRIHDMIQSATKKTAFSFHDAGEAVLDGQRLLNQVPFKERNDLIEAIIPNAAYEGIMKGSSLKESMEAIIGIAHQTRGIAFGNGVDRLGLVRGSGDGFHCLAGCSRDGWTPWISLLPAGKVWKTRAPAMPGCMTSTSF